ncbi:MAG: hypothetical protein HOJ54_02975, partial [Phycisphaerae bacterium]|nr:hypothetical protein [Phycisphaerae bacterium]
MHTLHVIGCARRRPHIKEVQREITALRDINLKDTIACSDVGYPYATRVAC